nr:uncharacterized protein LOC111418781 [Onthophagus taurus]
MKEITENWNKFKTNLESLSSLRLPRLIISPNSKSVELHIFCDATSFLCAKSRVAPLKTLSIPRLELCGAVLLVDLLQNIKEALLRTIRIDSITGWTSSQVTLAWIWSEPSRWKVFVANRVTHIQEHLPSSSWRYISSQQNPADCGSRGLFPSQLIPYELWWKGPSWLREPPENWPSNVRLNSETTEITNEQKPNTVHVLENSTHVIDLLLLKFSSISRIKRTCAYILRVIHHCRKRKRYLTLQLLPFKTQKALYTIIHHVQLHHFSELFTAIRNNKLPDKCFRKLAPFLDRDGLIRVGGRIKNAVIPFDHKHPVLLPKRPRVSELIVEDIHKQYLHPGQRTLQNLVMQQYWILGARSVIHKIISRCIRCFRCKSRAYAPWMADLPPFRVSEIKAFSVVAVDFAEPIYITISRCRGSRAVKSYISVFVCTATKAIHLELVSDLTTEAFIAALRRFISRRGRCFMILSDQGTNFIGAYNRLQEMAEVAGYRLDLTYQFHPPGVPHFNGLTEAGVKAVKGHLLRVIGDQKLTFEEVYTVLTQIEAVLNLRPLSAITIDPNDLQSLTLSHFLFLEPQNSVVLEKDLTQVQLNRLDRWKLIQAMVQHFWKRWHVEYITTLQLRHKWNSPSPSPAVGDLVIIRDEQQPPLRWETGRICEIHPGEDGIIRVVTVKTTNGRRPTTKICPLPIP